MDDAAADFDIGEEVLCAGIRFVVAGRSDTPAYRYRLLATTSQGAKVVWAPAGDLERPPSYTRPRDDSADY